MPKKIYWDMVDDGDDPNRAWGDNTARIIDMEVGGVVAYCHKDAAPRLVKAFRIYRQVRDILDTP
jgi:hypothetical protein